MASRSPEAFRNISEAAQELGVPQHVLRFWETKFAFVRPMKRAGGRRFYRPQDIEVLAGVRTLLHGEGYTIKGVQNLYRQRGLARVMAAAGAPLDKQALTELEAGLDGGDADDRRRRLQTALRGLQAAKATLDALAPAPAGPDS